MSTNTPTPTERELRIESYVDGLRERASRPSVAARLAGLIGRTEVMAVGAGVAFGAMAGPAWGIGAALLAIGSSVAVKLLGACAQESDDGDN